MPGVFMGFVGSKHLFWSGVSLTVVTYIFKFIGTVFLAFGSGLATSFAAYLVENHKNKNNEKRQKKSQRGSKAA